MTTDEVDARLHATLPSWRFEQGTLVRTYRTSGWKATLMAVNTIGHLAEAAWHHPELVVGYDKVTVRLTTHSAGAVTDKDFALAAQIEAVVLWRPAPGDPLEGTPDDPRYAYMRHDP